MKAASLILRLAAVGAGLAAIYYVCLVPLACNRDVLVIELLTQEALSAPQARAATIARDNIRDLQHLVAACRTDADLYLLMAFNANILGRRDEAISFINRALTVDQRPDLYFERGMLLLQSGSHDAALEQFTIAAEFNPNFADRLEGALRANVAAAAARRRASR